MHAASSPRLVIRKYTIRPITAKASSAPPGPDWAIVAPEDTNRPVPIEPPMAIMFSCTHPTELPIFTEGNRRHFALLYCRFVIAAKNTDTWRPDIGFWGEPFKRRACYGGFLVAGSQPSSG
ncbi:hypothetical protein WR25_02890 [Diploscapter pachys]|uniref:Uncharacterized protein n=1 Tax=Diploscapter pachys TaxID=2018661 RepID=A0A2A2K972_9BILA|nr:hypothetical protein WR25_02890 [Diploscapter pachys]